MNGRESSEASSISTGQDSGFSQSDNVQHETEALYLVDYQLTGTPANILEAHEAARDPEEYTEPLHPNKKRNRKARLPQTRKIPRSRDVIRVKSIPNSESIQMREARRDKGGDISNSVKGLTVIAPGRIVDDEPTTCSTCGYVGDTCECT